MKKAIVALAVMLQLCSVARAGDAGDISEISYAVATEKVCRVNLSNNIVLLRAVSHLTQLETQTTVDLVNSVANSLAASAIQNGARQFCAQARRHFVF